jgi:hypothetical protein
MLINYNGRVARDVTGNFLFSFLVDKAAEPAHINVMPVGHVGLHNVEKSFNGSGNIRFIDAGLFCYLVNYVCLSHGNVVYILIIGCNVLNFKFQVGKVKRSLLNHKMNLLIITHMNSQLSAKSNSRCNEL